MTRIRSIHPEILEDERMATLPSSAMRTFVLLWMHLDDEGRAKDNPRLVKAAIYPLNDDMTAAGVDYDLQVLADEGLLLRYEVDGVAVLAAEASVWAHQKPRHPTESKLPAPPEDYTPPTPDGRSSTADRRKPAADRRSPTDVLTPGDGDGDGDGDGVLTPLSTSSTGTVRLAPTSVPRGSVAQVFAAWQGATGRQRAKLDAKRTKVIRRALSEFDLDDVLDAVKGWQHSPHHRGENERHTVYNDLELLLRDAQHIERFRDLERDGPPAVVGTAARPKSMSALDEAMATVAARGSR